MRGWILAFCFGLIFCTPSFVWSKQTKKTKKVSKKQRKPKRDKKSKVAVVRGGQRLNERMLSNKRKKVLEKRKKKALQQKRKKLKQKSRIRSKRGMKRGILQGKKAISSQGKVVLWGKSWTKMPLKKILSYVGALRKEKLTGQAVPFLQKVLAEKYHPRLAFALAVCAEQERMWPRAVSAYLLLRHMENSNYWKSWASFGIGRVMFRRRKFTLARYRFFSLVTRYEKEAAASAGYFYLGQIAIRQGYWNRAIANFEKGGRGTQEYGKKSLEELARLLLERKSAHYLAIQTYLTLSKRFPAEVGSALYRIAKIYDRLDDRKNALMYYRMMLKKAPAHKRAGLAKTRAQALSGT